MLRDAEPGEMGKAKSDTPGTVLTPCEAARPAAWPAAALASAAGLPALLATAEALTESLHA